VIHIQNAPANTKFRGLWCVTDVGQAGLADAKMGGSELSTDRTRDMYFSLVPAADWAVGKYRFELYVNGVLDTVKQFRVK
jgi:hypothetical protein